MGVFYRMLIQILFSRFTLQGRAASKLEICPWRWTGALNEGNGLKGTIRRKNKSISSPVSPTKKKIYSTHAEPAVSSSLTGKKTRIRESWGFKAYKIFLSLKTTTPVNRSLTWCKSLRKLPGSRRDFHLTFSWEHRIIGVYILPGEFDFIPFLCSVGIQSRS